MLASCALIPRFPPKRASFFTPGISPDILKFDMASTPNPALPHSQYERFEGVRELEDMFDELIPRAERVIRVFDKSLSARYNAPARCGLIRDFLRADPLNRLFIVVHEVESLARLAPRFVTLLQHFGHVAKVRQTPRGVRHIYDPFVVFD